SPSLRSIRFSTPPCGAETSRSILSVSSSTSGSPTATTSPSRRSHFATRASTMDSPTSGTTILAGILLCLSARERPACLYYYALIPCPLSLVPGHARAIEGLADERLLIQRVARRRSLGRACTARPCDFTKHTTARHLGKMRTNEIPRAHVLRLFLHPDNLVRVRVAVEHRAKIAHRHGIQLFETTNRDFWMRGALLACDQVRIDL